MLKTIVYLYELVGVGVQLAEHGCSLLGRAVLKNALNYAATVRVSGQRVHLPHERVDYELQRRWLHAFNTFLYLSQSQKMYDC